ncbi:MAG TPA: hypothetical protein VI935_12230 [Thermodesulfobacteriota bacterium]|nr:hypothetical protein [Thermodesulfobacteriota bacterium]
MKTAVNYLLGSWSRTSTYMLRTWWDTHGSMLMRIAIALMVTVAIAWLGYQFWRLLWQQDPIWPTSPSGAVDLNLRYKELHRWFAGEPVPPVYPPASYIILWPLLGWLPFTPVKWFWAVTTVAALVWLVFLVVKESGANTAIERVFVALMPISMYATGATIGNGQLIIHILPAILAGLLILQNRNCTFGKELLAVALIIFSLVKPNVSIPFLWVAILAPGRLRPALLVALGYIALTLFALSLRETPEINLLSPENIQESPQDIPNITIPESFADITKLYTWSATWAERDRYSDLPVLLTTLGLKAWIIPVTLFIMALQGLWTFRYRNGDIWLLVSVAAIIARVWAYHRWFDDLLILLPMVALFRIANRERSTNSRKVVAGVLLAITLLSTLAPGGLYLFPPPWNSLYAVGQSVIWVIVLIFLLDQARCEKKA